MIEDSEAGSELGECTPTGDDSEESESPEESQHDDSSEDIDRSQMVCLLISI